MAKQQRRNKNSNSSFKNVFDSMNLELIAIEPKTDTQSDVFDSLDENQNLVLLGKAGCGKSFLAIYDGLKTIEEGKARKLVIVRAPVATHDIGHLPGDLAMKGSVYEEPYEAIVNELFKRGDAYGLLKKHDIIEFKLSAYIRGITIDNAVIVFDEIQNAKLGEAISVITRVGKGTKIHFCGDIAQTDLKKHERQIDKFLYILDNMREFDTHYFAIEDIVRSGLVKSFLTTQYKLYGDEILI